MNDDFDDLDRALFALPLEEPPEGLRAAILGATVYAPSSGFSSAFSSLETVGIGVAVALAAWVAILCFVDPHVEAALNSGLAQVTHALLDMNVLVWLGVGMLASAWIWTAASMPWLPFGRGRSST